MSGNVLGTAILELRVDDSQFRAGVDNARRQADALTSNLTDAEASAAKTGATLDATGRQAGAAGSQMEGAGRQVSGFGTSFGTLEKVATGALAAIGGALTGAIAASVGAGISFESAFANVIKTVDATDEQIASLSNGIRGMATEIPASAVAIAGVASAAGQLGIETDNILGFTRVMTDLGVATDMSAEQAASSLAQLANITQMPQTEFSNLGSSVVELGNNLATTESRVVDMGLRIAAAGSQIGLTEAEILGFAGALSSLGIEAQSGGTAISRVMIDVANSVAMGGEKLDLFASTAGMSVGEFQRLFQQDAASAIIAFVEGLDSVSQSGGNVFAVLDELGLSEVRVRDALLRMAGGGDILREAIDMSSRAWEENIALTKEAELFYGTTANQWQIFKNNVVDLGIALSGALLPAISSILEGFTHLIQFVSGSVLPAFAALPSSVQTFIVAGAGLVGVLSLALAAFIPFVAMVAPAVMALGGLGATVAAVGGAIAALAAPVAIAVAAIAALAAGAYLVYQNWDSIVALFRNVAGAINDAFPEIGQAFSWIGEKASEAFGYIEQAFDWLTGTLTNLVRGVRASAADIGLIFTGLGNAILGSMQIAVAGIMLVVDGIIASAKGIAAALSGDFEGAWDALKGGYGSMWDDFTTRMEDGVERQTRGFNQMAEGATNAFNTIREDHRNLMEKLDIDYNGLESRVGEYAQKHGRAMMDASASVSDLVLGMVDVAKQYGATAEEIDQMVLAVGAGVDAEQKAAIAYAVTLNVLDRYDESARSVAGTIRDMDRASGIASLSTESLGNTVAEVADEIDEFALSLGTLGDIQDVFQANIAYSAGRVSEWQGHLQGAETALGFLQDKIDAGIPLTATQAEQYEVLTGAVARYAGGVEDEMHGLVAAEVAKAKYIKAQDDLNAAIERSEENLEPYKQAMRDAVGEMDPAALAAMGLTDAQGKLVKAIEGVVGQLKELMIALGIIPPDTDVNVNLDATDAITSATLTREELELIPDEKNIGFTADESAAVTAIGVVKTEIELVPSSKEIGFTAETHGAVYDIDGLTKTIDGVPQPDELVFTADNSDAVNKAGGVTNAVKDVPNAKNVDLTATDNATIIINGVAERLGRLPSNFTVQINADAAGFYATVQGVDNYIPRSPAKEGPFSRTPDWSFMWEGLPIAAGHYWNKTMEQLTGVEGDMRTVGELQTAAWADGIQATGPAVIDAATSIAGETSTAVVEELGGGRQFQSETFLTQLNQFSEFILNTVIASATEFEVDLIDAASGYMEATKSAVGMLSDALELMASLQSANTDLDRAKEAASAVKFLTEHVVKSIGDSAAYLDATNPEGFVTRAEEYAQSAQTGLDLMTTGAGVMATLSNLIYNLDTAKQAASDIKFLTEHIMLSIGDSAEYIIHHRDAGFVPLAADYAEYAGKGVDLMTSGAELLATLSGLSADLDRAKSAASDVKFLTEHIVLSIGDSAAYIAGTRGPGFIEHTRTYAEAAMAALALMGEGVATFGLLEQFEGDLEIARTSASDIKFLIEHIVQSVGDSASLFNTGFLEHISTFVTAATSAQGLMVQGVDTVAAMLEYGAMPTGGVDLRARATEMVALIQMITAEMQTAALTFETAGLSAIESFSSAADAGMETMGNAGDALEAILLFALVDTSGYDLASMSQNMVDLIVLVTQNMEAAAAHFETKGLESVERFASAAGSGLGTMSQAGDAIASMLMYGEMTPEERDNLKQLAWEFTGVMDYLISMIQQVASNYNTDALEALTKFAGDATKSLNLIKTAADAFKAMVDHSRVTQGHADDFVRSWEVMVWTLQEIAQMVSNQGVQEAIRILNANQEIFSLLTEAFNLHQQSLGMSAEMGGGSSPAPSVSTPDPVSTGSTAMPVTGNTPTTTGSGSSSSASVWERTFGMTKAEWIAAGKPQLEMLASGGVVEKDTIARIGEGNLREAVIPLDNGGASIVAQELVDRMRAAPGWVSMGASIAIPTSLLNPWQQRGGGDDVEVNFNAPVTINARDRQDAERAMADVAWGVQAARKRRGR